MALDKNDVVVSIAHYKVLLYNRFKELYNATKVDETEFTGLVNKMVALKKVENSLTLGLEIPKDDLARGILDRAFDSKIASVESEEINDEKSLIVTRLKGNKTIIKNKEDTAPSRRNSDSNNSNSGNRGAGQ